MKNNNDFLGYLLLNSGDKKFILQLDEMVMNEITTDNSIQGTAYLYPNKHIDYIKANFYSNYDRENIQEDIKEFVSDYIYNRDNGPLLHELHELQKLKDYIHKQIADRITGYGMYVYWISEDKILKISVDREKFMRKNFLVCFGQ